MGKLYVMRHGKTEWNLEGRIQGRSNSPLLKKSREQAIIIANELKKKIYSKFMLVHWEGA